MGEGKRNVFREGRLSGSVIGHKCIELLKVDLCFYYIGTICQTVCHLFKTSRSNQFPPKCLHLPVRIIFTSFFKNRLWPLYYIHLTNCYHRHGTVTANLIPGPCPHTTVGHIHPQQSAQTRVTSFFLSSSEVTKLLLNQTPPRERRMKKRESAFMQKRQPT